MHRKDLPGSPDIVLPKYKTVIFVHGCLWHMHENCKYASTPKSRQEFWEAKFRENINREKKKQHKKFNPILINKTDFETLIKNSHSSFWQKLETWINTKPDFELSDSELILLRNALGIQKTFKPNLGQSIRLNNIYERALKKGFPEKL